MEGRKGGGRLRSSASAALALFMGVAAIAAVAQTVDPEALREANRVYVEGGRAVQSDSSLHALGVGVTLPLGAPMHWLGGALTPQADLFIHQWRATAPQGGRESYTQVGVIGLLRYRFDEGRSPWFAEAGLGLTQMDSRLRTPDREFSTRFQFTEVLAVGRNFGSGDRHELSLRAQHVSNGSIRKPNPGANFVRVRYAYAF